MKIRWETSPHPGAYKGTVVSDDGRSLLVQVDWDYPSIASTFGWDKTDVQRHIEDSCEHERTDGTIVCPNCGLTPGDFIASAGDWLDEHDGVETDDPGYFE